MLELQQLQALVANQSAEIAAMRGTMAAAAAARGAANVPKPAMFTGSGAPRLTEWLYHTHKYVVRLGVPPEEYVSNAVDFLGGAAFDWWAAASQEPGMVWTFEEFAKGLRRVFCPVDDAETARSLLDRLRQGRGPLEAHIRRFMEAVNRVPALSQGDKVHRFLHSLNDDLAEKVAGHRPRVLDAAVEQAISINDIANSMRRQRRWLPPEPRNANVGTPDPMELGALRNARQGNTGQGSTRQGGSGGGGQAGQQRLTKKELEQRKREGRCYECGEKGHLARDCPRRRRGF